MANRRPGPVADLAPDLADDIAAAIEMPHASKLEYAELPISQILPNPKNPRRHPAEQIRRLRASLRDNGQPRPLLVRRANKMLVAGHGVWQAATKEGWSKIGVMLWDVGQREADRYMLADNRHAELSEPDVKRVVELLEQLDAAEYLGAGFSDDEANKLLGELDDVPVMEIETTQVHDDFWISVRGPLQHQAAALQRLRTLLAEFPEVSVELSTIPIE